MNDTSQVIRDNELCEEQWKKGYPRGRRPSFYARTKHPAGGQVINEAVVEKRVIERVPSVTIEDTWPADELSRPPFRTVEEPPSQTEKESALILPADASRALDGGHIVPPPTCCSRISQKRGTKLSVLSVLNKKYHMPEV